MFETLRFLESNTSCTLCKRSSIPSPELAETKTVGTPIMASICLTSISSPSFSASSDIFKAKTIFLLSFKSSKVKSKFRCKCVESNTLIMTSYSSFNK